MIRRAVVLLVEGSHGHAGLVVTGAALLVALVALVALPRLAIDTDVDKLIARDLPWRRAAAALDRDFPQNANLLAIVIDGATPDQAADAADLLAARLRARPALFHDVREPGGDEFIRRNGLLFLPVHQVQKFTDDMIAAQPLIGTLAADPNLRGVFTALDLLAEGGLRGEADRARLAAPIDAVTSAVDAARQGRYAPVSWQNLFSGRKPDALELRRFVVTQPVLDYGSVQPGRRAIDAVHAAARAAGLAPSRGVSVRVTGAIALNDDQFAALSQDAGWTTAIPVALLCLWLLLGLRSWRGALSILLTLAAGLVLCGGGAALTIGAFNPISVAFAPLFVGIAIDFGIQFGVRHAAERRDAPAAEALRRTAVAVGPPLAIAAAATAVGFYAFIPTAFSGVSDLGWIAGTGMLLALLLNLSLLPALLTLLRPRGAAEAAGLPWGAGVDAWVLRQRRPIIAVAAGLAVVAAAVATRLRFDFNLVHLQNPRAESVRTLYDLTASADTTPYTIKVLEPSAAAAAAVANQLRQLPEVAQVLTLQSFVPTDQAPKLELLSDARDLLAPTLWPVLPKRPPSPAEVLAAIARCARDMREFGNRGYTPAARLAAALDAMLARGAGALPALAANLTTGIEQRLEGLRLALEAGPVTLATLPPALRDQWIGRDGRWCVEAKPRGDASDNRVLARFADAVARVAPSATGDAITLRETARMVTHAFATATVVATVVIAGLLLMVLRRLADVAGVLGPLILAAFLTLATAVLVGLPLNFANIITVPLLLGIGVAFDIYFVMRWRSGEGSLLRSSTARAVVFSALTTGTAFGSLAASRAPQLADMGKLLLIALAYTLVCTLIVLPAMLGPVRWRETR